MYREVVHVVLHVVISLHEGRGHGVVEGGSVEICFLSLVLEFLDFLQPLDLLALSVGEKFRRVG